MQKFNMGDMLTVFYKRLTIRRVFFLLSVISCKACQLRVVAFVNLTLDCSSGLAENLHL